MSWQEVTFLGSANFQSLKCTHESFTGSCYVYCVNRTFVSSKNVEAGQCMLPATFLIPIAHVLVVSIAKSWWGCFLTTILEQKQVLKQGKEMLFLCLTLLQLESLFVYSFSTCMCGRNKWLCVHILIINLH